MGKTTSVSSSDKTACCSNLRPPGVGNTLCDSTGSVTQIDWSRSELSGPIPPEIGRLASLKSM
jgi:hypothetical protein